MVQSAAAIWINTVFGSFDLAVATAIHQLYNIAGGFFTPFMNLISFFGHDGIPLIVLSLLLMIFPRTRRYGTGMLFGLIVGALVVNCCLKIVIARARPYVDQASLYYQYWQQVGMATESDKSFPSGHVTAAFDSMVPVYMLGNKKYSWLVFIFCILMCISRIYLCVHYCSDVLAGMIVGILAGIVGCLASECLPDRFYEARLPLPGKKG